MEKMFMFQCFQLMENIIQNMGVYHGFEKNETATMFFLKKPSLVQRVHFKSLKKNVLEGKHSASSQGDSSSNSICKICYI